MKRILVPIIAVLTMMVSCSRPKGPAPESAYPAFLDDPYSAIKEDIFKGGGEYNMYPLDMDVLPTAAPKGYKPFYISHFGRHGARYNLGGYGEMKALLESAHKAGQLTELGELFFERYEKYYPHVYQREGDLTYKGELQQFGIAERMVRNYPEVFRRDGRVEAVSSTSNRSQLTMSAFCLQIAREKPELEIVQTYGNKFMPFMSAQSNLNPSNVLANRLRAANTEGREAYLADHRLLEDRIDALGIALRIFKTEEYVMSATMGRPLELAYNLYYLAASTQAIDYEEDFHDLLSEDQWCSIWEAANHSFYANYGPGPYYNGCQWASAHTLLNEIVLSTDEDLENGGVLLRARFGHDVGVMALLALMDAEGFSVAADNPLEIKNVWQSWNFMMSVNLQWIFYRNAAGDILVRMMLNEKDINLPIGEGGPYYGWDEFRSFCLSRISVAKEILGE